MEHRPITESVADDFELRNLTYIHTLKDNIKAMAEDMRHHAKGLEQLRKDGELDETEATRLREALANAKEQVRLKDLQIQRHQEEINSIRKILRLDEDPNG